MKKKKLYFPSLAKLCVLCVISVHNMRFVSYASIVVERDGAEEDGSREDGAEEPRLTLQELKDKNAELKLVCEELTVELAAVLQDKINLRAKLLQT